MSDEASAARGEGAGAATLLHLDHVDAGYGPFRALFGVSLSVAEGQAVALLGANGAGKTTVARVATGLVAPTAGQVWWQGQDLTGRPTFRFARAGITHAPEGRSVFATLSVEENLVLWFRQEHGRAGVKPGLDKAYDLFPRLGQRRTQAAGSLSGGEQRMLSLARVMVDPPRLLVVDELSLGLAPIVVEEVYRTLRRIQGEGTALLVVEQQMTHALDLADEVVVLDNGRVVHVGPASDRDAVVEHLLPSGS
jgi:branched-chain amino acid transport system ATP-binding protein